MSEKAGVAVCPKHCWHTKYGRGGSGGDVCCHCGKSRELIDDPDHGPFNPNKIWGAMTHGAVGNVPDLLERCRIQSEGEDEHEPDYAKLHGEPRYGARVRITWDGRYDGWEADHRKPPTYEDRGYIMGLPGIEEADPDMGAIVHIPDPENGMDAPPVWITLYDLLSLPDVLRVEVGRRVGAA